ncbi:glutaredoxin domain-containing protein [Finegoldia magna]|uniref:glutaredoxin domain-containing protein n=1 Tax=Finegoldia magna TaxID=1260 RepID=UPI0028FEF327|nr:glutaredoxin domain-containing protein [Finegoldia magna]MDU3124627.1 glutaredoxin domain-containing protein [Finegoldia magna]MDU5201522.1 glutaredoxin domain-containing protein [Finegoldia magna]MDU6776462.1 glutaredoxin domain-containing protein [Finegoldia magna]MDU7501452.1 glutaredoxin domain-containing protein [Finegoldia magna]
MKLKLYMSEKCPDCVDAIEIFKNANIDYEEINITDSMKNLKEFFTYRDNRKEFESIVKDNKVGVPMITDGEKIVFFEKLEDLRVFNED